MTKFYGRFDYQGLSAGILRIRFEMNQLTSELQMRSYDLNSKLKPVGL